MAHKNTSAAALRRNGRNRNRSISLKETSYLRFLAEKSGWLMEKEKARLLRICEKGRVRQYDREIKRYEKKHYKIRARKEYFDLPELAVTRSEGGIFVGDIVRSPESPLYGAYYIRADTLKTHGSCMGPSGCGKTCLMCFLLKQWKALGYSFVVFDRKRDYRNLAKLDDVLVFKDPLRDDRLNIFEPLPTEDPNERINTITRLLGESFYFMQGTEAILKHILRSTYQARGVFDGSRDYPSIYDIINMARVWKPWKHQKINHRGLEWKTTVFRVLDALVNYPAFVCKRGHDIAPLLKQGKSMVYEVLCSDPNVANFYINMKLHQLRALKKACGIDRPFAVVLEEAHNLFNPGAIQAFGENYIMRSARAIRDEGFCLFFVDQVHSEFNQVVLQNLNTNIYFRTSNKSIHSVASQLALDKYQYELFKALPPRHAIVTSVESPRPCLVRVRELVIPKVSDEQIDRIMAPVFSGLSYKPAYQQEDGIESKSGLVPENRKYMVRFLRDVRAHPFDSFYKRINRLKSREFVKYQIEKTADMALEWGFVKRVEVPTKKRSLKTFYLTEKGVEYAGLKPLRGKHGPEGNFWLNWVVRKEPRVAIEKQGNDAVADYGPNESVVYEWESTPRPHVRDNFLRALKCGPKKVVFVCHDEKKAEQIWDYLKGLEQYFGMIEVKTLRDFV